jgi:hypothetical protein
MVSGTAMRMDVEGQLHHLVPLEGEHDQDREQQKDQGQGADLRDNTRSYQSFP